MKRLPSPIHTWCASRRHCDSFSRDEAAIGAHAGIFRRLGVPRHDVEARIGCHRQRSPHPPRRSRHWQSEPSEIVILLEADAVMIGANSACWRRAGQHIEQVPTQSLVARALIDPDVTRAIDVAHRHDRSLSPATADFVRLLRLNAGTAVVEKTSAQCPAMPGWKMMRIGQ
jgi:hypothetical protein